MNRKGSVFGGALIIAGTSVGAGMLGLPILTGMGGVIPAVTVYVFSCLLMLATGLLLVEACVQEKKDLNLITLSSNALGPVGKVACFLVYIFLFYSLMVSYLSASRTLLPFEAFQGLSPWVQMTVIAAILAPFIFWGAHAVDGINRLFLLIMVLCYLAFLTLGFPLIQEKNFTRCFFLPATLAFPVSLLSFGFQGVVPSIVRYLDWDGKKIAKSLYLGTGITLVMYVLWGVVLLGMIPYEGPHGLKQTLLDGKPVMEPLSQLLGSAWVAWIGKGFAFFAIVTSFLGVALGLRDFLADGLGMVKRGLKKGFLVLFVFIPPLFIASSNPKIFLKALSFGGGLGGTLLLGLLPVCIAWKYREKHSGIKRFLFGGRSMLVFLFICMLVNIVLDLMLVFGQHLIVD